MTAYQAQRRGGRGKAATSVKDEDFVDKLFVANTHDTLLCFSSRGKLYWLKVYQLPQASRGSRGKPIVNLLPLQEGERINAVLPIHEFEENKFVFMATAQGTVKKTSLDSVLAPAPAPASSRSSSTPEDRLVGVDITDGQRADHPVLERRQGDPLRRERRAADGPHSGRRARHPPAGGEEVISLIIVDEQGMVLTASENGYGKRTPVEDFPHARPRRPGRHRPADQRAQRPDGRRAAGASRDDEIMLISSSGTLVRTPVGRNLDPGPQHPGRTPDPARRGRSPGRAGAHPRRRRG